jgi:predicted aminopeptidase
MPGGWRRARRIVGWTVVGLLVVVALAIAVSPDVRFVLRGGWEEARLLLRRQPLAEAAADTTLPAAWRRNMRLVISAREWADSALGLTPGSSYTTFAEVGRDTLILVLSAAPKNSLQPYRWWFPIVGSVPYHGYFSRARAEAAQRRLEARGYDTALRPAAAFSTLGWFSDPLLSTVVRGNPISVVETVIHEMAHATLYVPNATPFDESFASLVGFRGAEAFFRARGDTAAAAWTAGIWRDEMRLGVFYGALVDTLRAAYATGISGSALDSARALHFGEARTRLASGLDGTLERYDASRLAARTLNNATVVGATIYRTRLDLFERLYEEAGGVREAVARLREAIDRRRSTNPYDVLETLVEGVGGG